MKISQNLDFATHKVTLKDFVDYFEGIPHEQQEEVLTLSALPFFRISNQICLIFDEIFSAFTE